MHPVKNFLIWSAEKTKILNLSFLLSFALLRKTNSLFFQNLEQGEKLWQEEIKVVIRVAIKAVNGNQAVQDQVLDRAAVKNHPNSKLQ
ncbi:MAG: hypothetical protein ACXW4B_02845 [Micavibrio sp.]